MGRRPNPDGWQGGSEDFTYLRGGMEGHIVPGEDYEGTPQVSDYQNAVTLDTIGLNSDQGV